MFKILAVSLPPSVNTPISSVRGPIFSLLYFLLKIGLGFARYFFFIVAFTIPDECSSRFVAVLAPSTCFSRVVLYPGVIYLLKFIVLLTSVAINGGSTATSTLLDFVGIADLSTSWGLSLAAFHGLSVVTCGWSQAAGGGGGGRGSGECMGDGAETGGRRVQPGMRGPALGGNCFNHRRPSPFDPGWRILSRFIFF